MREKKRKINLYLSIGVLVLSAIVLGLFTINMMKIMNSKTGTGTTVVIDSNSSIKNDLYIIGNNPTELGIKSFEELTKAIKEGDPAKISEGVVKNFIIDYFTWTNKDGNYEIGGLQYIYGPNYVAFEMKSRWSFYEDLDLYIAEYGRENLLEVDSVSPSDAVFAGYYIMDYKSYDAYYVEASWTYKKTKGFKSDEFQKVGYFTVINNNGRFEIVKFFDKVE